MPIAEFALPLGTAVSYVNTFVSYIQTENMRFPTSKAFTIRASTLLQALGMDVPEDAQNKYVRAYLGMDENNAYRLMFTPVLGADIEENKPGVDVILDGDFKEGSLNSPGPVLTGQYVLDFTAPCPNLCNPTSPLFV